MLSAMTRFARLCVFAFAVMVAMPAHAFETATPATGTSWAASNFTLPNQSPEYRPITLQATPLQLDGGPQELQVIHAAKSAKQTVSVQLGGKGWQGAALDNRIDIHLPKLLKRPIQAYATGGLSLSRTDAAVAPGLRGGGGLAYDATQRLNIRLGYTASVLDLAGAPDAPAQQLNASLAYRFP